MCLCRHNADVVLSGAYRSASGTLCFEKVELRNDGTAPVGRGVRSGICYESVVYATCIHGAVKATVDFIEEIVSAAIKDYVKLTRLKRIDSGSDGVGVPTCRIILL